MPESQVSGETEDGGADSKLVAIYRASWVMLAPCFCVAAASDGRTVLDGWTAKTNSKVPRTPSGRRGSVERISINLERNHGGAWFGRIRRFNADMSTSVPVLEKNRFRQSRGEHCC